MNEPVAVRVRDCECPGAPHAGEEGDVVFLAPVPSMDLGLAAEGDIVASLGNGDLLRRRWFSTYIRFGTVGWNLLDPNGDPVPFNVETILADYSIGITVAERADELYGDIINGPLVRRLEATLRRGPTNGSTSKPRTLTPLRQRPSSRGITAASKRRAG